MVIASTDIAFFADFLDMSTCLWEDSGVPVQVTDTDTT